MSGLPLAETNDRPIQLRDRIACAVSNWVLNHVASPWYRNTIDGIIRYGAMSAARDASAEGIAADARIWLNKPDA